MDYGFVRVGAAAHELRVADCIFNTEKIIEVIKDAEKKSVEFLVFPELCITGYTCGDLFLKDTLLKGAKEALVKIAKATSESTMVSIVGLPLIINGRIYNCAAVLQKGKILGIVPKTNLPNYNEFYEDRWFTGSDQLDVEEIWIDNYMVPVGADLIFASKDREELVFGIEICEDLWSILPPSSFLTQGGATLLFNLSAGNELVSKAEFRRNLVKSQSSRCVAGYVYASSNSCESTTDAVFSGHLMIAENGNMLKESERFFFESKLEIADIDLDRLTYNRRILQPSRRSSISKNYRIINFEYSPLAILDEIQREVNKNPFVPENSGELEERCSEILSIQTLGLMKRIKHTNIKKLVIGVSGGLDSTLAFIVIARVIESLGLPMGNIIAVTMPGFGTTGRTYDNSVAIIKEYGADLRVIDIKDACLQHFRDIGHDKDVHDVTYENVQARERTQILMDIANKEGGLVVGTGDLSEIALGWSTYNGDHMSMYTVNSGVPKTLVRHVINWYAAHEASENIKKILYDIIDTPISPELLPPSKTGEIVQKTEDILGPYEVHDFFLYYMQSYGTGPAKLLFMAERAFNGQYSSLQLKKWLTVFCKRFFSQQFKRSCMPDGPKVGTIGLSPRSDWKMPSDASVQLWLSELDNL
ncbi:MAG: NAD(+) synthase [Clostridiaceae bacterium]|jgi:NAD+ synthase (glutamine-hydrolysing)|nr:NAD(+) synthase [Clostridiaceae bacterium]